MCKEIDYIRHIFENYNLKPEWVAKQLNLLIGYNGWTRQRVWTLLNNNKEISTTNKKLFDKLFAKFNLVLSDFEESAPLLFRVSSLNLEIASLNNDTVKSLSDGVLSYEEKDELLSHLSQIEKQIKNIKEQIRGEK